VATVSRKAVNQMIVSRMLTLLVGDGVAVYPPHRAAPNHDPDQGGDTPVDAWCKVHRVALSPAQNNGPADQRTLSFTVSVGVSPASLDADPHALDDTLQKVVEALEHATVSHGDGVHTLQLYGAESDILTAGGHNADGTGVVSVGGCAKRAPS
jgi:hypothetical protein